MTQVDWHPYPKEKPKFYEPVLVTLLYHDGSEFVEIDILHCYQHLKIKEKWGFDGPDRKVIAWAELPEPYKPPIEKKQPVHIDYFGKNADDIWGWNDDKDGEKE